jgi:uncharacterized small protein (DUF1192 family)
MDMGLRTVLGAGKPRGQAERGGNGNETGGEAAMAMFEEEPVRVVKRLLDDMSIQDLKERIEALKADIAACEAMIIKKEATRKAAEAAFFKS